jgi:hypothetical protein
MWRPGTTSPNSSWTRPTACTWDRRETEDPGDYLLRAALVAIEQPGTVTLPNGFD